MIQTRVALSFVRMKRASVTAWEASLPTTRKNDLIRLPPIVNDVFVADAEMYAMPLYVLATACTSWLPAGPTTATTFESAASWVARVAAWDATSCVSASRTLYAVPFRLLSVDSAYFAHLSCSWPIDAALPVNGPMRAIVAEPHATAPFVGAAAAAGPAVADALPYAAAVTASVPIRAAASTTPTGFVPRL